MLIEKVKENTQIITASTALFYSYSYWKPFPEDAKPERCLI